MSESQVAWAYLKEAKVNNYRSIKNASIKLKPGLNIIIGENGAGKTNFFKLISQLITPYRYNFVGEGCSFILHNGKDFIVKFEKPIERKATKSLFNRPSGKAIRPLISKVKIEKVESSDEFLATSITEAAEKALIDIPFFMPVTVKHGVPTKELPIIGESINFNLKEGAISYSNEGESLSNFPSELIDVIGKAFTKIINHFYPDKNASKINLTHAQSIISKVLTAFLDSIRPIFTNYSPIEDIRFDDSIKSYFDSTSEELIIRGILFEYKINEDWLPFDNLSDGTKRIIYALAEIQTPTLIEFDASEPELEVFQAQKIIFLEEPELGIHPDQLHKLLSFIRETSYENQVIMTTHSPQVLNMLTTKELDRITICEFDPEKGTQFRKLSPAKRAKAKAYMQNDSYLSDFWLYSNLEAE